MTNSQRSKKAFFGPIPSDLLPLFGCNDCITPSEKKQISSVIGQTAFNISCEKRS